jgi:hypothetical protein
VERAENCSARFPLFQCVFSFAAIGREIEIVRKMEIAREIEMGKEMELEREMER